MATNIMRSQSLIGGFPSFEARGASRVRADDAQVTYSASVSRNFEAAEACSTPTAAPSTAPRAP
jgi:hypothetical protein